MILLVNKETVSKYFRNGLSLYLGLHLLFFGFFILRLHRQNNISIDLLPGKEGPQIVRERESKK